jgi:hypothetical protein
MDLSQPAQRPGHKDGFNDLEFGRAILVIEGAAFEELRGTIGGKGWSLTL